jgi:hypothetical protein
MTRGGELRANNFKRGQLSLFPDIGRTSVTTRGKGRCSTCGWRSDEGHAPECVSLGHARALRDKMRMLPLRPV